MLTVTFENVSSRLTDVADYHVVVRVNRGVIAVVKLEGHRRTEGWQALVQMLADRLRDGK